MTTQREEAAPLTQLAFPAISSLIGDIDPDVDKGQDLSAVRAEPIPETRHF